MFFSFLHDEWNEFNFLTTCVDIRQKSLKITSHCFQSRRRWKFISEVSTSTSFTVAFSSISQQEFFSLLISLVSFWSHQVCQTRWGMLIWKAKKWWLIRLMLSQKRVYRMEEGEEKSLLLKFSSFSVMARYPIFYPLSAALYLWVYCTCGPPKVWAWLFGRLSPTWVDCTTWSLWCWLLSANLVSWY